MDPRKLRKLLEILNEFGVKEYRTDKIQINLDPDVRVPVQEDQKVFSMDDYTGSGNEADSEKESIQMGDDYSDEQILHWSSGA